MFGTRHFVLSIIVILFASISIVLLSSEGEYTYVPMEEVIFSVPKDSYGVADVSTPSVAERREVFIERVRAVLSQYPVEPPQDDATPDEAVVLPVSQTSTGEEENHVESTEDIELAP